MRQSTLTRQRLVGIFLVSLLLLFSPVVVLFERMVVWFGIPAIYFYLFGVWFAIIAATALIVRLGGE